MMNSHQRVSLVLEGKLPDRVPVLLQNFQNVAYLAGISLNEFSRRAEAMAEAQIAAWQRFGYDILDLENGTAALAEAVGCPVTNNDEHPPRVSGPAIPDLTHIDRLKPIDPHRDGTLPTLLKATRLVKQALGDQACIVGEADQAPFSLAGMLVGLETWLVALMDPQQEALVLRLLDYCTQQVLRFALAQAEAGADFVQIGDAPAGPDMISPRLYRKFAWPYERYLAAELKRAGVPLILHICGDTTPIIADMASSGAPVLEIDYKVDMDRCRQMTQDQAILAGNVDPSRVMAIGSPEEVLERCKGAIRTMGRQGGFILSPGCTLPATTPAENTEAMVEAARQYGIYGPAGLLVGAGEVEEA